jgi:hypothetical protein
VVETVQAPFDPQAGSNAAKLKAAPAGEWSLRAWLTGDAAPAKVTQPMPPAP